MQTVFLNAVYFSQVSKSTICISYFMGKHSLFSFLTCSTEKVKLHQDQTHRNPELQLLFVCSMLYLTLLFETSPLLCSFPRLSKEQDRKPLHTWAWRTQWASHPQVCAGRNVYHEEGNLERKADIGPLSSLGRSNFSCISSFSSICIMLNTFIVYWEHLQRFLLCHTWCHTF